MKYKPEPSLYHFTDPRSPFTLVNVFPRRGKINPETLAEWKRTQERLRRQVRHDLLDPWPTLVAGVDCAFLGDDVLAAAVLWHVEEQRIVAEAVERRKADVPYIPGYLGFREAPAVLAVLAKLPPFEAVLCDGQGVAHPRRCGLAVHVGVTLDKPAVGVAKSRLVGTHEPVGPTPRDHTPLLDGDERIGTVVRTRLNVKPLYVSVGHRVRERDAVALVLACQTRYRLPEPTRLADKHVARYKADLVNLPTKKDGHRNPGRHGANNR
ncbi:MAG: endonuclease V [Planctomycetota bacterium]